MGCRINHEVGARLCHGCLLKDAGLPKDARHATDDELLQPSNQSAAMVPTCDNVHQDKHPLAHEWYTTGHKEPDLTSCHDLDSARRTIQKWAKSHGLMLFNAGQREE